MEINVNGIFDSLTPVGVSQLGTVVFDNVVFPSGFWLDLNQNLQTYNEVKLDSVQLVVNRTKEIVKSKVSGRDGSIKEHICFDDYTVNLTAIVASKTFSQAQIAALAASPAAGVAGAIGFNGSTEDSELISALSDLEKVPDRVEIRSKFLQNYFAINYVVIESFSIEKDGEDFKINMNLLSDFDTDLKDFG